MRRVKTGLSISVAIAALVSFNPAVAQVGAEQDSADENQDSGQIVVTARRQSELLRDVPASVSVLTEDALVNSGATTAEDFTQLTAGVTIVAGNTEAGDNQVNIRGLNGARDGENNVALVIDGVLKTNVAVLNQDHGELEQVEILKGPQGALYGRNAAAGAIVITTKGPTDYLTGSARVGYATDKTITARALLSGPISDNAGFVINGDFARSDGFLRNSFLPTTENRTLYPGNTTDPASINNYSGWNINGRLVLEPSDVTKIDAKVRYGERKGGAISFNAIFQIPFLADLLGPDFNIDANDHQFVFAPNIDPLNQQETLDASIKLETDLGFADLSAYVAYNNNKNFFYADGTSGSFAFFNGEATCQTTSAALAGFPVEAPFGIGGGANLPPYSPTSCDGTQYQQTDQEDISAEIRLAGGDSFLNWQAGVYYLHLDRRVCRNLGLDTGQGVIAQCFTTDPSNPTEALIDDDFKTDVFALFGSVNYEIQTGLTAGLALRYDIEKRDSSNNVPTDVRTRWVGNVLTGFPNGTATTAANYYLNPGLDPANNPSGVLGDRSRTFKQLQPKLSISYRATDYLNLFANWGIGFKSGGFNNGGSAAVIDNFFNQQFNAGITIFDDFNKETSSAFEVGLKGSTPGNVVNYEIAGYYTDVTDMQFFGFFVGPFGLLRVVSNIDKVELYGIEASLAVKPNSWLTLSASGNITESEIKRNSARPNTVGNKSPYTADYTLNLGAEALVPVSDDTDILLKADYRLTGPTWFHTVQDNDVPNQFGLIGNFTNSQRDAFGILNLRIGINAEHWSLAAFAQNVTNKKFLQEVIPAPEFGGSFVAPGSDRVIGVEAGFKF
ncbi:pesticin receptor [Sphingorhabdus sp. SMR4y]|nr:pesticin receptor [Sphingorhabdus sp. SMR4y]